jgi:hypothetical protein
MRVNELGVSDGELNKDLIDTVVSVQVNPHIKFTGQRLIYIYSDDDRKPAKKYKVGETYCDPYYRVKAQDKSNSSSEPELIAYFLSPFSSDKRIHKFLPNHIRKEWFTLENPIEEVRLAIMKSDWSSMSWALREAKIATRRNLLGIK